MDIVSRLKLFLQQNGITNSQFADTCEIPRPTLSQLLNGRNKKVSDEIIGKIHRAYPSLNVMWLMFGDGEMLLTGGETATAESQDSGAVAGSVANGVIDFGDADADYASDASRKAAPQHASNSFSDAIESIVRSTAGRQSARVSGGGDGRRVVNIMVFYSDGRFEQFVPSR